jgi:hypothetical protein
MFLLFLTNITQSKSDSAAWLKWVFYFTFRWRRQISTYQSFFIKILSISIDLSIKILEIHKQYSDNTGHLRCLINITSKIVDLIRLQTRMVWYFLSIHPLQCHAYTKRTFPSRDLYVSMHFISFTHIQHVSFLGRVPQNWRRGRSWWHWRLGWLEPTSLRITECQFLRN